MKGKRIAGIFGFCEIKDFFVVTEALQNNSMLFINEIARIVHGVTIEYLGIPSLYHGDRFMLVWKIPESELSLD